MKLRARNCGWIKYIGKDNFFFWKGVENLKGGLEM